LIEFESLREYVTERDKFITKRRARYVSRKVIEIIWSRREAQTVDALAVRGDEGRGILRKALGSWKRALIQRCPNGGTRL
jgi:hypothetical protein